MKNLDYWKYDYLSVTVKIEKAEELIARYATFQWEETERKEDRHYGDIIHIAYRRKHRLPHKDRLQLLQVCMETLLNDLSRIENTKHSKSTAFGLITGTMGSALAAGGVTLAVLYPSVPTVIGGVAAVLAGAALLTLSGFRLAKIRAKEKKLFARKAEEIQREIEAVCQEAEALKGEEA